MRKTPLPRFWGAIVYIPMRKKGRNKHENKYDKVMRENLEHPSSLLLGYFFPGKNISVSPLPPKIRQIIIEQETDTLLLAKLKSKKRFILHWEFQTKNDPRMSRRMASYDFMLHLKYNLEVISIVIYIGNGPLNMNSIVRFNNNYYTCELIDIRSINPELFLQSDKPKEIILAILAGDNNCNRQLIIKKILSKLQNLLPESELKERITDLEIMGGLRSENLQKQIIEEEQKMPIIYDIRKDLRYKEGVSEGLAQGISRGISKGISRGIIKGSNMALLNTAKNMFVEGLDIQLIHKTTSLPIVRLKKLKKELENK